MKKKLVITVVSVLVFCGILIGGTAVYLNDYYRADTSAFSAVATTKEIKKEVSDGFVSYIPEEAGAGFIFYPGGKVEFISYEPLMKACAERGILCVLVEMPFNLAVLDVNAADGIREKYPDIKSWYIGGHSLGGSMAASYLGDNADFFDGLILLGSYSTENLSDTSLRVVSVFGSNDKVMNREKYEECKMNLPESFTEFIIDGGSHAYFGMYGEQDGDGTAEITNAQQIEMTADIIERSVFDEA